MLEGTQIDQYNKWENTPVKGHKPSKKEIADRIFVKYDEWGGNDPRNKGFTLSSYIEGAFFEKWSAEYDAKSTDTTEYITNIEYIDDHKNNASRAIVTIETSGHILKIEEKIEISYFFNEDSGFWNFAGAKSIGHKLSTARDLKGTYRREYQGWFGIEVDEYTIKDVLPEGYIIVEAKPDDEIKEYKYRISSKFGGYCECGTRHNEYNFLKFYKDVFATGDNQERYEYSSKQ